MPCTVVEASRALRVSDVLEAHPQAAAVASRAQGGVHRGSTPRGARSGHGASTTRQLGRRAPVGGTLRRWPVGGVGTGPARHRRTLAFRYRPP